MSTNNFDLLVGGDICIANSFVNLATADTLGDFVSMKHNDKLYALILMPAGTASEPAVISLQQATDNAATGVKTLNITDLHYKTGADLAAVASWTKVSTIDRQDSVASWSGGTVGAATDQQAVLIRIHADDLDVNNGFSYVRTKIADTGSGARTSVVIYIVPSTAYQGLRKPVLTA